MASKLSTEKSSKDKERTSVSSEEAVVSPMPILMSTQSSPKATERLRMRAWLEKQLDSRSIPGFEWLDKNKATFRIPWKHAARHGWDKEKDAGLFKEWAIHTGKYCRDNGEKANPKTWKANFRCALNSLPDIQEMTKMSQRKGSNAYKVYKMLPRKQAERKRKLASQMKSTKSSTRTNERASSYLRNNKHKTSTTDNVLRPRTRSMSRETGRFEDETPRVKTEVEEEEFDDEVGSQVELEIDPDEKQWPQPTTTAMTQPDTYSPYNPYPTPPQSAGFTAPSATVSGFAPLPVPLITTSTAQMISPIPSPITSQLMSAPHGHIKTEGQTDNFEYNMHTDDDAGSNSSGSIPTDDEVVEMVDEMIKDSPTRSSPINGINGDDILFELKTGTNYLPLSTSLLQSHQKNCSSALQKTEMWIAQLGSQQDQRKNEELPPLAEIPKPTFIKEPGDLDQYSEFGEELQPELGNPSSIFEKMENPSVC